MVFFLLLKNLQMKMNFRRKHFPLTLITALLVMLIAGLAGSTLVLLRRMHGDSAHAAAAEAVVNQGQVMVARLSAQPAVSSTTPSGVSWDEFSRLVHNLHTLEDGLQYVSVARDGVVVFHEQTRQLDGSGPSMPENAPPESPIDMRRELLQVGAEAIPVVVFETTVKDADGVPTVVRVALRKDTVKREEAAAGTAIASMFRLTFLTIVISFAICVLLVVWMMRREMKHEALRREQEHLAFSGMLANGIVHDFRNPMSSIRLDVQMLNRETEKGDAARPDRIGHLGERVRNTLDRMDKVFQEFLYVSRPDRDDRAPLDLVDCIRDCLEMLAPRFEKAAVTTHLDAPDSPVTVLAYDASLRRALVNILTNAEQFSPQGERVDIRVRTDGARAIVDIADNGPGIPSSMQGTAFDMFVTGRPEGTGLGLFLAKAAIERSSGNVRIIESETTQGACIRIDLPLAPPEQSKAGTESA